MGKSKEHKQEIFSHERECLELLRLRDHPNIVPFLGSYVYRSECSLLFPRLDMDLAEFFQREERFGAFGLNSTFYTALQGLSSALECVHNLNLNARDHQIDLARIGYHHDIRPRNILVTSRAFILADFGLAKMKTASDDSRTIWKAGAGDYIAPECIDQDFNLQDVGRDMDIWSLGCMIVDISSYMEKGPSGVHEAREKRRGRSSRANWETSYFFDKNEVNPGVLKWMNKLQANPNDSDLWTLLRLAASMIQIQPKHRLKATMVCHTMSFLAVRSLFHAAETALVAYYESLKEYNLQEGQQKPEVPLANVWFGIQKIKAWGYILEITDDLRRSFFDKAILQRQAHESERYLQEVLFDIQRKFNADTISSNRDGTDTNVPLGEPVQFYQRRDNELRRLIDGLFESLIFTYRVRIDKLLEGRTVRSGDLQVLIEREEDSKMTGQADYEELGMMASMKALLLAWSDVDHDGNYTGLQLPQSDLEEEEVLSGHCIGWYTQNSQAIGDSAPPKRQVLMERLVYSPKWELQPPDEKLIRTGALAELLHKTPKPRDFRVLDCLGFMTWNSGFSFLYEFPHSVNGGPLIPQTLLSILSDSKRPEPFLEHKYTLAEALVSSIHQLHTVGWLHKSINPNNVLFFTEEERYDQVAFSEPYLVSFHHSRPDGEVWTTEGPADDESSLDYQHPEYSNRGDDCRFHKRYDYYSIGLVLLEIGCWKPLAAFSQRHPYGNREYLRRILVSKYLPKLGRCMGSSYMNAVKACLECDGFMDTENCDQLSEFYLKVVEPINGVRF